VGATSGAAAAAWRREVLFFKSAEVHDDLMAKFRFLTLLGVRPGRHLDIRAHRFPMAEAIFRIVLSSAGVQPPRFREGSRTVYHLSLHSPSDRSGKCGATVSQLLVPCCATRFLSRRRSFASHFFPRMGVFFLEPFRFVGTAARAASRRRVISNSIGRAVDEAADEVAVRLPCVVVGVPLTEDESASPTTHLYSDVAGTPQSISFPPPPSAVSDAWGTSSFFCLLY